jgi:uncharacterized membrane protein SpoIIM required for sporulation
MGLQQFQTDNEHTWDQLERLVGRAGDRPESLPGASVRALGSLYRKTAADLAQARLRYPSDPVVGRLEQLLARARPLVYRRAAAADRTQFGDFFRRQYWQILTQRPRLLAFSALLLMVPAAAGYFIAATDPATAQSIVPPAFLWVTEPQAAGTDIGAGTTELTAFSTAVLVNNIRVTVLAFALGITFGLGTAAVTSYNGLILGAVAGLGVGAGNSALLVEAIAAHGILELSCIVVAAYAGLSLASGLVAPGLRPRRVALRDEATTAVKIIVGTAPWLILAGFVEGFVSRTGTTAGPAVVIGVALGGGYWLLAALLGRPDAPDTTISG